MSRTSPTARLSILISILPLFLYSRPVAGQYIARQPKELDRRAEPQTSASRDIYIAGHDDFCLFGPATPGSPLGQGDRNVVSWCNKPGHDTRVMPEGTLKGVTYIKAKNWVQVSGVGDFTKINVKPNDWGAQFDSADHNPEGAMILGGADKKKASSWVTMMTPDTFCFRACFGDAKYCPTTFAEKGCYVLLSNGVGFEGTFQSCTSEDGLPPAEQGDKAPDWVDCKSDGKSGDGRDGNGKGGDGKGGGEKGGDKPDDKNEKAPASTTSWVGVPTCIPCTGAESSPTPSPTSSSPSSSATGASAASEESGTIQQGVTKVEGLVAAESDLPSFISAPPSTSSSGGLILKRAEETTTKDGQCCFTTWTPTMVGAGGAGPTQSPASDSSLNAPSGTITGGTSSNVTNTALITKSSDGVKPPANATVSGGGKNGTGAVGGNGTDGNGTESHASRVMWGAEGPGLGMAGRAMAAVCVVVAGWAVL